MISVEGMSHELFWGAHAPSRAAFGALPERNPLRDEKMSAARRRERRARRPRSPHL